MILAFTFVFSVLEIILVILLLAASGQFLLRSWWAYGHRLRAPMAVKQWGKDVPLVTVQLPLRNERDVVERLLREVAHLDWPKQQLQIQVLDDSDDDTSEIVDRVVTELNSQGWQFTVLRWSGSMGNKAASLAEGLKTARGEFILVLDADSRVPADLLWMFVPRLFAESHVAFVQARWEFENERQNILTWVQAKILRALMVVEQPWLCALRKPVQFNGTGGLWRREALERSGGWTTAGKRGSLLVEDLDLSYRAKMVGLRGLTLENVAVTMELPATMTAFRRQQERWVRGGAELLRAIGRKIWHRRRQLPDYKTLIGHLARHARQPIIALFSLLLPIVVYFDLATAWSTGQWAAILIILHVSLAVYLGAAEWRLGRSPLRGMVAAPIVVVMSVGLSFSLTGAWLGGLLFPGARTFVRTPKSGAATTSSYQSRAIPEAWLEVVLGLGYAALATQQLLSGRWLQAGSLMLWFGCGYLWVGCLSISRR